VTLPLFWVPELAAETGATVHLAGEEGRHAVVVRRIRVGEHVLLTDGDGRRATCEVVAVDRQSLDARVLAVEVDDPADPHVTVVQAIAKGDRGELAVEVLTEVGVDRIVPWAASRSVAVWRGDRAAKSLGRWRSTARAAAKQARRSRFPEVAEPVGADGVVDLLAAADLAVVLHENATASLAEAAARLAATDEPVRSVVVVVGPEGGITPEELATFAAVPTVAVVRLGPTVLRTSTAGVAAVAALLSRSTRW
jgi:16S rRNA (uracil1498-N3)-methyltransferase